jgi:8-oxo-dGTP pyrophosphatase MutT (NUDIX family)
VAFEFVRLSDLRKLSECQQVAAVCYRVRGSEIEFLLVRTRGSRRWTFPKGSAEPGLTPAQAAALEAFEEAGVHGRIEQTSFARYISRKCGKSKQKLLRREIMVKAHLCQVLRLSKPKERGRDRTWFSTQEAKRQLRKGRGNGDAAEFARIVEKAVLRVGSSREKQKTPLGRMNADLVLRSFYQHSAVQALPPNDALQKVQFEASPSLPGWSTQLPILPNSMRKLETMQRHPALAGNPPRKLLLGEILPFSAVQAPNSHSNRVRKATEASQKR